MAAVRSGMYRNLSRLIHSTAERAGRAGLARWSGVLGLTYHRVGDDAGSDFDRRLWSADADELDDQVRFLKSHFDIVVPPDLPDILKGRRGRYVLLTFDDGYADNYHVAFPILKSHNVRATFFVVTGFLDHPRISWWDEIAWMVRTSQRRGIVAGPLAPARVVFDEPDREMAVCTLLNAYKAMPADAGDAYLDLLAESTGSGRYAFALHGHFWMNWQMVREMRAAGMVIGGHTVNHPVLAQLPLERQWEEVSGCARRLAEELGEPMRYFSYPVGNRHSFNGDTRACMGKADVQYAFSYYGGMRRFDDWDDYDVRRVAVDRDMPRDWFRAVATLPGLLARTR